MSGLKLPYSFAPPPRWIFTCVRDRAISIDDAWLLSTLFHLARAAALASGDETPSVLLDTLLDYVHPKRYHRHAEQERARDALRKRLARAQQRGLFSYRVVGNPATGYKYVFKLPTEPPSVSALCPTKSDASCPTSTAAEHGTTPAVAATDVQAVSDLMCGESLHPCPTSDGSCPTSEGAAIAVVETSPAAGGKGRVRA